MGMSGLDFGDATLDGDSSRRVTVTSCSQHGNDSATETTSRAAMPASCATGSQMELVHAA